MGVGQPHGASAATDASGGQQHASNGLHVHKGVMDSNSFRANGILNPNSGRGLELIYNDAAGQVGAVQAYDRDALAWLNLNITAKNINLQPQSGGRVFMPQGSAQAMLGSYNSTNSFVPPSLNTWTESSVQLNCSCNGYPLRIEFGANITSPTAGAFCYLGIYQDGAMSYPSLAIGSVPVANGFAGLGGVVYTSPLSGNHRISLGMYISHASTGLFNGANTTLWVSELRA